MNSLRSIEYPVQGTQTLLLHDLFEKLQTSSGSGLSEMEVAERNRIFGPNISAEQKKEKAVFVFARQFKSAVMALLAGASVIALLLGDNLEAIAILGVVLINAVIGFVLEMQAIRSMDALKKLDITTARVIREGVLQKISSSEIVPGDLICLEAGDLVPADARLVELALFETDESALTGESLPVTKNLVSAEPAAHVGDQLCMVFKGTSAVKGNAKAIVTSIGINTEFGKISTLVQHAVHASTPLEKKLESLTKKLIWITAFMACVFLLSGWIRGNDLYLMVETALVLAVAAIPEGLPVVATIALAYGMMRMAEKNVIVKKLASVETLGGTNIILTDKTGTLTVNRMEVSMLALPAGEAEWTGAEGIPLSTKAASLSISENFKKLLQAAVLCNNASVIRDPSGEKISGDPMEVSLLRFAALAGTDPKTVKNNFLRKEEDPFTPETRVMGTLHSSANKFFIAAKGAPEELLARCTHFFRDGTPELLTPVHRNHWLAKADKFSSSGLRTLAFAYRETSAMPASGFVNQLIFLGITGFLDPPRTEILSAMQSCREAGIRVVMVTGDHPATALNIARKAGLESDTVMTGKDLKEPGKMSEKDKSDFFGCNVFARVSPAQKLNLVKFFQDHGYVVGMTGDGVNDAPALKKADIGIAMGQRGTQVAQEAADMVLRDDSFISIVDAIEQGRIIFRNIRSFIIYLMSCNLGEIFIVSAAGMLDLSLPLLPLQILFLNLVTDVFPALALGMGKGSGQVMKEPPRNPSEPIIGTREWEAVFVYALVMTLSVFGSFLYCHFVLKLEGELCNNVTFFTLALAQLLHVFNLAPSTSSFFKNEITRNIHIWLAVLFCILLLICVTWIPFLAQLLAIQKITVSMLMVILTGSLLPVLFIQLLKRMRVVI